MKIKSLKINGVGGIRHLEISFTDRVNVICGANGVGKTTIIDIISDAFSIGPNSKLKRNAFFNFGEYDIKIWSDESREEKSRHKKIENFSPIENESIAGWYKYAYKLLHFDINRDINYVRLKSVMADPTRTDGDNGKIAINGIRADDIKNWFINRYLFKDKVGSLSHNQLENYKIAEDSFGILDNTVSFNTVTANTFDIKLKTSKGIIYFEYLSAGYKSCIYIILGIIKEIEYRTAENPVKVSEFEGVILIDEVDLHLHPIWQAELIKALKIIFTKAQFIFTTHSPSILQTLNKDEIIALGCNEEGETYLKELNLGKYGLQGWSLEEILRDVMEMPTTTSETYREALERFDTAMNNEDRDKILQEYELLKEMLHPDSSLRKLLSIQVAEWEE